MKYDVERAVVSLSVGELCALALLGGDLDLRPGMTRRFSVERAAIGAQVHRKLQAEAGVMYDAEVSMTNTTFYKGISFEVSGRADGVLRTDPITVDEIKTVNGRSFELPPSPLHDAQVKCYAYFLCREKELLQIATRLTYYRLDDGKTKYLTTEHSLEELRAFYENLLERILYRAQILIEHETILLPTARCSRFPYPSVREGQDIMLKECFRDIRYGKRLFIEAPTGTGKTLSALFPAVQALGKGFVDKIFYLTAKASTRREAYHAAAQIFDGGAHLRTVVLSAREQVCKNELAGKDPAGISRHCNPNDCPYAKGFYDRCGIAVCDALQRQHGFNRGSVEEIAEHYHICPYEFQLELSVYCDIIICDYNYVFDPQVYLRRYFEAECVTSNRYVFLIDEAHNLGDRACDMYSAVLSNAILKDLWKQIPESQTELQKYLEKLTVPMQGFRRLCADNLSKDDSGVERGYYLSKTLPESFLKAVADTRLNLEKWLRTHSGDLLEVGVYQLISALKHFEVIGEYYDEHFLTFITTEGDERVIRLICLDPSQILSNALARAHASVLFSATLTPPDYFADILGGGKGAVRVSLPSPFDPKNLCIVAVTSISTKFEDRSKAYKKLVSYIAAAVSGKRGNYIVYFPSYDFMENVLELFCEKYPLIETVIQKKGMKASDRDEFLNAFRADGKLRIGFCVLGGSFSEGVDLPGKQLIGVVIVGAGLPGLSNERNILKEYYDITRENGYDYAYTYPGMNRVLQAAGRVIRREDDKGVVVLIDDRYGTDRYKNLFPDHWNHIDYAGSAAELAEMTKSFWKNDLS